MGRKINLRHAVSVLLAAYTAAITAADDIDHWLAGLRLVAYSPVDQSIVLRYPTSELLRVNINTPLRTPTGYDLSIHRTSEATVVLRAQSVDDREASKSLWFYLEGDRLNIPPVINDIYPEAAKPVLVPHIQIINYGEHGVNPESPKGQPEHE